LANRIVLVLTLLALLAPAAHAEKRVVVLDFSGPKGAAFRSEILKLAKPNADIIPSRRYELTSKKVRRYRENPKGVSEVAERIDVDGIITGRVKRRRGRYTLTVRMREGVTGEYIGREIEVTLRRPRVTGKARKRLSRQLRSAIRELPDLSELKDTSGGDFEDDEEEDFEDEDENEDFEEEDFEEEDFEEEDFEDEDESEKKELSDGEDEKSGESTTVSKSVLLDRQSRGRGLELAGGLSFSNRNLSFSTTQNLMDTPQGYAGRIVPGFTLGGSLYTITIDARRGSIMRNFGLTGFVDKILRIESKLEGDEDTVLATSQTKWGIGAIYRHNFGSKPTSPTVRARLRYSRSAFIIDKSGVPPGTRVDIPNVTYVYAEPGVSLRFPVTSQIAFEAEANLYQVLSTGDMQLAEQYGGGTVRGFDFGGWGEYVILPPLSLKVGARLQRFSYTFDGSGALTHRDGNMGEEPDVEAATDQYLSLYTMVGYLF